MERKNIQKTVGELFNGVYQYIVPLYQRNFAWTDEEISQLMRDIYENYRMGNTYFVGSIVYIERKEGEKTLLEVIDGQQRLTVLTLLLYALKDNTFSKRCLDYDARKEVTKFLDELYSSRAEKEAIENYYENSDDDKREESRAIELFIAAIKTIKECNLDPDKEENGDTLEKIMAGKDRDKFVKYVREQLVFVLAEMPSDTEVATYFEIMNNTGEQLRKHEIVKSLILGHNKLTDVEEKCFAKIWDACSQMDKRIERAFSPKDRVKLFGDDYKWFYLDNVDDLETKSDETVEALLLADIVTNKEFDTEEEKTNNEDEDKTENVGSAIIDFPNFLMHIFKLYNDACNKRKKIKDDIEIPLNEKDLLRVYKDIKDKIKPMDFIRYLLFYRVVFDRYIIRAEKSEDGSESKWALESPYKDRKSSTVRYESTFKNSDKVIKALSTLQVSYSQRNYKNYLYNILSWFEYGRINYDVNLYLPMLNKLILDRFEEIENFWDAESADGLYKLGTSTPRFVLNFVDYLMYCKGNVTQFDFKYYNSVEHHLPRSSEHYNKYKKDVIDSIGNLFLVSKRVNSSLNDNDPLAKAKKMEKNLNGLSPNRRYIYKETLRNKQWESDEIIRRENDIREMFKKRREILKMDKLEPGILLYRAALAVCDYCERDGVSCGGDRYNFTNLDNEEAQKAIDVVKEWINQHEGSSLEDFIQKRSAGDENLTNFIKERLGDDYEDLEPWRRAFVEHSLVMEFCRKGKFAWLDDGKTIYLLPNERQCSEACELRIHLLYERIVRDFPNVYWQTDFERNKNSVIIPLDETPLLSLYKEKGGAMNMHVGVSEARCWFCYVCSKRNGNSSEVKTLRERGWTDGGNNCYYKDEVGIEILPLSDDIQKDVNHVYKIFKKLLKDFE